MSLTLDSPLIKWLETGEGSIMGALYASSKTQVRELPVDETEELEHAPTPTWQETVLKIVWMGIEYVGKHVPISPNYLTRTPIDPLLYGIPQGKIFDHFNKDLETRRLSYQNAGDWNPLLIRSVAELTKKSGSGRCDEMVVVGIDFLQPHLKKINAVIESYQITNGKHVFSIIRRVTEKLPDEEYVDPEGVIGDFWTRDAFPVSEKNKRLFAVKEIKFREDGLTYPVFAPLNQTHKLVRIYSPLSSFTR